MSTGKTGNLNLNQWAENDNFLMEEFNADNRKVDAAVAALPYVKLMEITTSADASIVELNVSGIDLTKYAAVQIFTNAVVRDITDNSLGNGYQYPFLGVQVDCYGGTYDVEGTSNNSSFGYVGRVMQAHYSTCAMQLTITGFQVHPSAERNGTCYHTLTVHCAGASNGEPSSTVCSCNIGAAKNKVNSFIFYAGANDSTNFRIKANSKFSVYGVKL